MCERDWPPNPLLLFETVTWCLAISSNATISLFDHWRAKASSAFTQLQFDHKRELKKLNMSILVNFLDLLDILIKSPGSIKREEKLEDLKLLFVHIHHLINEYPSPPGQRDTTGHDGGSEETEAGDGWALPEAFGAGGGDDPGVSCLAAWWFATT